MNIVDQLRRLTSGLQDTVGATAADETWSQIAAYLALVEPQVEALKKHLGRSRALGAAANLPCLERVRSALERVEETFYSQPHQLAQGRVAESLRVSLTDAVKDHRDRADEAWSAMREAILREAPEGLLRLYGAIPGAQERARSAATLRTQIVSANRAPADVEDLRAFKEAVDRLGQHLAELGSLDLSPVVERFLERALVGEARWVHLTPAVVDWLKEYEILPALRITIV